MIRRKWLYHVPYTFPLIVSGTKGGRPGVGRAFTFSIYGRMKSQRKMAKAMNRGGYDLAFIHHSSFIQAPYILRYLRIPSVYFMQEHFRIIYEPSYGTDPQQPMTFRQRYYLYLMGRMDAKNVHGATRVLTNSEFSRESINDSYGIDAKVCYLGVDTEAFHPLEQARKQDFVLSVGALSPHKGFEFIVASLARLPAACAASSPDRGRG